MWSVVHKCLQQLVCTSGMVIISWLPHILLSPYIQLCRPSPSFHGVISLQIPRPEVDPEAYQKALARTRQAQCVQRAIGYMRANEPSRWGLPTWKGFACTEAKNRQAGARGCAYLSRSTPGWGAALRMRVHLHWCIALIMFEQQRFDGPLPRGVWKNQESSTCY